MLILFWKEGEKIWIDLLKMLTKIMINLFIKGFGH